jgi:hypothetical protein
MSRAARSDLIDLRVTVVARTAKAVLVRPDGASAEAWLPRGEIEIEEAALGPVLVTLPEWLALDRGLI